MQGDSIGMRISGKTRIVALLGFPVEHTLSPEMHNRAFQAMGLDYCYVAFEVHPDMLKDAVSAIKALGLAGVNVTVPHKERVIPLLDRVDEEAAFIGAVNTVVNNNGRLTGYNTDGKGFMRSLEEEGVDIQGKSVFVIGAGGAARAISFYLSEKAATLFLYDTDAAKSERLVGDLSKIRKNVRGTGSLGPLPESDVVINATPLGLKPSDPFPCDVSMLNSGQTVIDLIYRGTPFQAEASRAGCRTLNGLGMLLWQGVLASELWTGVAPPHEVMRKALIEGL